MKKRYEINDRVEYYMFRGGKRYHRVGYVKNYKRMWFCGYYMIAAADGTRELDVVKASQLLGLAPKKEFNKQSKSNENGNI